MMYHFVWRSAYKRTLPNSVLIEGTAIGESYLMELSSEVGIVSCPTIHPRMEQIKRLFPPVLEALMQPREFQHPQLFDTIPRL